MAGTSCAQPDTTVVKSLLEEAFFYNASTSNYLPLVDYDHFNKKTLHLRLRKSEMSSLLLRVGSTQELAIFFNQRLAAKTNKGGSLVLKTDSLFNLYGPDIHCTVYNPNLSAKNLTIQLLTIAEYLSGDLSVQDDIIILNQRNKGHVFNDFLILGFVLIAAFLATLYNYYPRVTIDFLRFGRALAIREMDENLLKSRPFAWINVLFYIFFSLLAGYLLISIFYLAPFQLVDNFVTTWLAIWFWLKVSGVIMLWLLVKFLLIRNFTVLFNIKFFLSSHYFNYIRIGLFIFMSTSALMIISYLGFNILNPGYYNTLFNLLLIAVTLRVLFLMLKLMNSASYKFLHLFSYLCGTEIIPLGMILFLGFNQPF